MWTAVLMLSSMKSPALYMQAAFRAQNPCLFVNGTEHLRKENAYIFDFDSARALIIYEKIANDLAEDTAGGKGDSDTRKEHVRELLNFFPVIGEDEDGEMIELDAEKVLSIPRKLKSQEVVRRGFMSDFLFQNISNIFHAPQAVIDILQNMDAVKEPTRPVSMNPNLAEDLSLNDEGQVELSRNYIIGEANSIFENKIFSAEKVSEKVDDIFANAEISSKAAQKDEDRILEQLKNAFRQNITDPVLDRAKEQYSDELSETAQKQIEKKLIWQRIRQFIKRLEILKFSRIFLNQNVKQELMKQIVMKNAKKSIMRLIRKNRMQ